MPSTLEIQGMHCKSCKMLIEDELEELGITEFDLQMDEDAKKGTLTLEQGDDTQIANAIEQLGDYKVTIN